MIDQEKVADLMKKVEAKKQEIAKAAKPSYITNLTYPFLGGENVNLASVTSEDQLVGILGDLLTRSKSYAEAAAILGVQSTFRFGVNTLYSVQEWTEDIKTRMLVLNLRKNKDLLGKLEAGLEQLESEDVKKQRQLEEITQLLHTL